MANRFLGKAVVTEVDFLEEKIKISKLSVGDVLAIQAQADIVQNTTDAKQAELENIRLLNLTVQRGAKELSDLTEEEMQTFAMEELTKLAHEVMRFSGLQSSFGSEASTQAATTA